MEYFEFDLSKKRSEKTDEEKIKDEEKMIEKYFIFEDMQF